MRKLVYAMMFQVASGSIFLVKLMHVYLWLTGSNEAIHVLYCGHMYGDSHMIEMFI